jgi:hypothetical protein
VRMDHSWVLDEVGTAALRGAVRRPDGAERYGTWTRIPGTAR